MEFLRKNIGLIIILGWLCIIFGFSSQSGEKSSSISKGITKKIVVLVEGENFQNKVDVYKFNKKLRKVAHFLNYLTFSTILYYVFRKRGNKKAILLSLLICGIIASTDEFYQSFIPGREARVTDIIIDMSGAMSAILIIVMKEFIGKRVK